MQQNENIHRYEMVSDLSGQVKFWEIEEPHQQAAGGGWVVNVRFGRKGTEGQKRFKALWSAPSAKAFYHSKIAEKTGKGYKYVKMIPAEKSAAPSVPVGKPHSNPLLVVNTPELIKQKPAPECQHTNLRRVKEGQWKCSACKLEIDFDKPPQGAPAMVEAAQVRRFFNFGN
jgi:predicted DNA-binding WGR domain protein